MTFACARSRVEVCRRWADYEQPAWPPATISAAAVTRDPLTYAAPPFTSISISPKRLSQTHRWTPSVHNANSGWAAVRLPSRISGSKAGALSSGFMTGHCMTIQKLVSKWLFCLASARWAVKRCGVPEGAFSRARNSALWGGRCGHAFEASERPRTQRSPLGSTTNRRPMSEHAGPRGGDSLRRPQ